MSASTSKSGWLIPTGLIMLVCLPSFAGVMRLIELSGDSEITANNARFFADPVPAVIHIVGTIVFCVIGAFQFSPSVRQKHPVWHRLSGRALIPFGLLSALTGMWMAMQYPPVFGNGIVLTYIRLVVGVAIVASIYLGFTAIRRRAFLEHRAWMMRAYALGIAAGTQPLTLGLMFLLFGEFTDFSYTLGLSLGWLVNIVVVERLIQRQPHGIVQR